MPGLLHEISTPEAAAQYAKAHPVQAIGDMLWAILSIQRNCECRMADCKAAVKQSRLKNVAMQVAGGVAGGAAAAYGLWIVHRDNIIAAISEYLRNKIN
jgi:hypothetical protein